MIADTAKQAPFHLAFPVDDLVSAEAFYGGILGCAKGRFSEQWIDFNFFGHQLVAHLSEKDGPIATNNVDGKEVPIRHFGVILTRVVWKSMIERLTKAEIPFLIEPSIRFENESGEQGTFFVQDPAGNTLEFKYFDDPVAIFASRNSLF